MNLLIQFKKMPFAVRCCALAIVLICILAFPLVAETDREGNTFDVITKVIDTPDVTVWRVEQPNVMHNSLDYPQIWFLPGDILNVDAGGCVQTGGEGLTWKRYVDPSGPDSDRFYHGLIEIRGLKAMSRFPDFGPGRNYTVNSEAFLRLGYEDDDYGDNGYYEHDNGNEDQCRHVGPAWVIVSVGHNGVTPPPASQFAFVGITPNNFRDHAGWAFRNFRTPQLSWNSFMDAFNLNYGELMCDPFIFINFLATRGIASGGVCAGMCLLAEVGEDQFVVGDLKEDFWANYKTATESVSSEIHIAHWKQFSSFFMRTWLKSVFDSPSNTANAIERDLTKPNYNYGLLSITHGVSGHVLVPLSVTHVGPQTRIDVYDPNRESSGDPNATYPQVIVDGPNWSYLMAGGDTWGGPEGQVGSGFAYIPYVGSDGWSDLGMSIAGVTNIVFGNDVTVEQVTDGVGKHLYVPNQPGVIDNSAEGLGRSLVRIPLFADAPRRPRSSGPLMKLNYARRLTSAMGSRLRQLEAEYGADYGGSGQIYLATTPQLKDLTFTLSAKNQARPIRALIRQKNEFFEIKSVPQTSALTNPSLVIHDLTNFSAGVSIQDRNGTPLKVTFTHGIKAATRDTMIIEKTDGIPVTTTPIKAQLTTDSKLQMISASANAQTRVNTRVINPRGNVRTLPARTLTIRPPN
jgi:hypothetical protein